MRAIIYKHTGTPDVLTIEERPKPEPMAGSVVIKVKALGLNRAETYFRSGKWPKSTNVIGIECVGEVEAVEAHRALESYEINGKMVVEV